MAPKQRLPRLSSGFFSKRGFERTVPDFYLKKCGGSTSVAGYNSQRIELRRHDEVISMKTSNLVCPESNCNAAPLC